ncbi:HIRAN domain-containing protein [Sporosarcina luteola]|uniref:HIRAN domain-containing protein n=1 Tax=Sporosarcina luteola TaxID=582850 RepID=UPI0020403565|nr:HIRAN domain-containing protein [Sporosarcina luteola]MCM3745363.1 HIRAN domain-containing protein [Sporosarcina luteola]
MIINTSKILTFPKLNERFGINLVHSFFQDDYSSNIYMEVIGDELYGKFKINIDIYDENGTLIMPIKSIPIDGSTFDGITANRIRLNNRHLDALEKCHIRIYPTNSYLDDKHFTSMTLIHVGLNYGDRRNYIDKLNIGDFVTLTLDKYNEFDKFAVKVSDSNGNHIGYLNSDCAFVYNQFLQDDGEKKACILKINKSSIYLESPVFFSSKNIFLFGE